VDTGSREENASKEKANAFLTVCPLICPTGKSRTKAPDQFLNFRI
jgi:hypothetical protein